MENFWEDFWWFSWYVYPFFLVVGMAIVRICLENVVPKDEVPPSLERIVDVRNNIITSEVQQFWDENLNELSDKEKLKWTLWHTIANACETRRLCYDLRVQQKNNVVRVLDINIRLCGFAAFGFVFLGFMNFHVSFDTPRRLSWVYESVEKNADVIKEETNQIDSAIKIVAEDFQKKYADLEKKLQAINDNIQKIDSNLVTVNDNLRTLAR